MGSKAKPLALFTMNSCRNSASTSYSITPGFTKFKYAPETLFGDADGGFQNLNLKRLDFTARTLVQQGLEALIAVQRILFHSTSSRNAGRGFPQYLPSEDVHWC
jgi:hypothetical protein